MLPANSKDDMPESWQCGGARIFPDAAGQFQYWQSMMREHQAWGTSLINC